MEAVDYLKGEEVVSLLDRADAEGVRESLMVRLPLFTGARIGEISPLAVGDCEPRLGKLKLSKVCFVPAELAAKPGKQVGTDKKGRPLFEWSGAGTSKGRPIYDPTRPVTLLLEGDDGYTGKKHRDLPAKLWEWVQTQDLRHECVKEGLKSSQPTRAVPLSDGRTRQILADWIRDHDGSDFIFKSQKGGRLEKQQIQRTITRLMKESKISEDKCYPHMLRHTFAVHFLKKNPGAIFQLARILGHTNIKTTTIYLRFVVEDLQAILSASGDLFSDGNTL